MFAFEPQQEGSPRTLSPGKGTGKEEQENDVLVRIRGGCSGGGCSISMETIKIGRCRCREVEGEREVW